MKSRKFVTWAVCCGMLALCVKGSGQSGTEGQRIYEELANAGFKRPAVFVQQLNQEQKRALTEYVRSLQKSHGKDYGNDILLCLGEPSVRREFIEHVRKADGGLWDTAVGRSGDLTIIPELAPEMFKEEAMRNVGSDDSMEQPSSYRIANVITQILSQSPSLTGEVRQWAEKQTGISNSLGDTGVTYRNAMRQWWIANEEHFRKKDYLAVRPGRDLMQEMLDRFSAIDASEKAAQKPTPISTENRVPPAAGGSIKNSKPEEIVSNGVEPDRSLVTYNLWAVGFVILGIAVAVICWCSACFRGRR